MSYRIVKYSMVEPFEITTVIHIIPRKEAVEWILARKDYDALYTLEPNGPLAKEKTDT